MFIWEHSKDALYYLGNSSKAKENVERNHQRFVPCKWFLTYLSSASLLDLLVMAYGVSYFV
jgi:hypothetical protein